MDFLWRRVIRARWWIITATLVFTVVCTLVAFALPKQYDASVLLRVDPTAQRVVGDTSQTNVSQLDSTVLMTTEAQILTSPAVVLRTIETLGLANQPEFKLPAAEAAGMPKAAQTDNLIQTITKRIQVIQPVQTYLLEVHFTDHNPQMAAAVANGLANSFLDEEYTTRAKALDDSTRYMTDQLNTLRAREERDQEALVNYESTNDVIDPDDKSNIYNARLNQFNADLSQAAAQRMQLQAENDIAQSGNVDALMVTSRGAALIPFNQRVVAEKRKLAQLATIYGVRHPLYIQQAKAVSQAEAALESEADHIRTQVADEYQQAVQREQLIQAGLNQAKKAMDAFNLRAVKYDALKAAADSSATLYADLQRQIQDATVAAGLRSEDLRIINPARAPDKPASPKPWLIAALAFMVSLLGGIGVVVARTLSDRTLSSPEQSEALFGVSTIAGLPESSGQDAAVSLHLSSGSEVPAGPGAPAFSGPYMEAMRSLHASLRFSERSTSCLAVTSPNPAEGKSTAITCLALSFASTGSRTVLVDADMRKPKIHRNLQLSNRVGLSSVLSERASLDEALVESGHPNLMVLPSGPSVNSPSELLQLRFGAVLEQLRDRFDQILVDCPPILGFSDSLLISSNCDGALLVVRANMTDRRQVLAAIRSLKGVRAVLLGLVLNRVGRGGTSDYYNYYYTQSNYYHAASADGEEDDDG